MELGRHLRRVCAALAAASCALALGSASALAGSWHAREVVRRGPSQRAGEGGGTASHRLAERGRRERRRHDARIGGEGGRRSSRARRSRRLRERVEASIERCVSAEATSESYVTFVGQMTSVKGSAQMAIRIDVEQRAQGETSFHRVTANGLGAWRLSDPGVKVFSYVKQVTNLAAPAAYRGLVRFHWLDAEGDVIKRARMRTPVCRQLSPVESRFAG